MTLIMLLRKSKSNCQTMSNFLATRLTWEAKKDQQVFIDWDPETLMLWQLWATVWLQVLDWERQRLCRCSWKTEDYLDLQVISVMFTVWSALAFLNTCRWWGKLENFHNRTQHPQGVQSQADRVFNGRFAFNPKTCTVKRSRRRCDVTGHAVDGQGSNYAVQGPSAG